MVDTQILRAIARLSRTSSPATFDAIELRVAAEPAELRAAIARLSRGGLVTRRAEEVRLTMFGLAVAVASAADRARKAPRTGHRRSSSSKRLRAA